MKPYLANKKDKTFLDHCLLGNDLAALPGAVGVRPAEHGRAGAARPADRRRAATIAPATSSDLFGLLPPDVDRLDAPVPARRCSGRRCEVETMRLDAAGSGSTPRTTSRRAHGSVRDSAQHRASAGGGRRPRMSDRLPAPDGRGIADRRSTARRKQSGRAARGARDDREASG